MHTTAGFKHGRLVDEATYMEALRIGILRQALHTTLIANTDELYPMHKAYQAYAKMAHNNVLRAFDIAADDMGAMAVHFVFIDFEERGNYVLAIVPNDCIFATAKDRLDALEEVTVDVIAFEAARRGRTKPEKYTITKIQLSNGTWGDVTVHEYRSVQ